MRVAETAESMLPYWVKTTTATCGYISWTCFKRSRPLEGGRIKSVTMMSIACVSRRRSASSTVAATTAFIPQDSATSAQSFRVVSSSSTTRTLMGIEARWTAASSLIENHQADSPQEFQLHKQCQIRERGYITTNQYIRHIIT